MRSKQTHITKPCAKVNTHNDADIQLTNGIERTTVRHRPKVEGQERNEQLFPLPHANLPEKDGNRNLAKAVDDPECNGVGIFAQHAADGNVDNNNL